MTAQKPLIRTEVALVLIVTALVVPQMIGRAGQATPTSWTEAHGPAALTYARQRLWSDFLEERSAAIPGYRLPEPSMSEYRAYLRGRGLERQGDAVVYLILPALHPDHLMDRVRVRLATTADPLRLNVALLQEGDRPVTVGSLHIAAATSGGLQCLHREVGTRRLWTYWPITPQPLLP
jgi:hypothetical protein